MTKELIFTIQRLPAHRIKILELYEDDQDFRQLCSDYLFSTNMVEAFRKTEPDIKEVQRDYEQVSKDLEIELLKILQK